MLGLPAAPRASTVALLGAVLASALTACAPPAAAGRPRPAPRLVYLAPAHAAHPERQPYPRTDWQAAGVALVYRFADLRAAAGVETEVIALDAEVRPTVDTAWLRAQLRQRRTIVGINIDLRDLQEAVDDTASQPWTTHWRPDVPFFAVLGRGPACGTSAQDPFRSWGPADRFVEVVVLPVAACAQR
jgi:hypothetical protein